MKKSIIISILMISAMAAMLSARSYRVDQLPNGSQFGCANCHVSSSGGGTRTAFGQEVMNNYLQSGNVVWNTDLAALDSDGDGATNGQELQDPDGLWSSEQADPGDADAVTNPGDENSTPAITAIHDLANLFESSSISLLKNYPNPFNAATSIEYHITKAGVFEISIFSTRGQRVYHERISHSNAGSHNFYWHARSANGRELPSGSYFLQISGGSAVVTRTMILLK